MSRSCKRGTNKVELCRCYDGMKWIKEWVTFMLLN